MCGNCDIEKRLYFDKLAAAHKKNIEKEDKLNQKYHILYTKIKNEYSAVINEIKKEFEDYKKKTPPK